jgi:hypothetical protein
MPQPTVGRIVHYVSAKDPSACQAAIITAIPPDMPRADLNIVDLTIFAPGDDPDVATCREGDQPIVAGDTKDLGGTWHWPEQA